MARYAQHWNFPGGPADVFAHKLSILQGHCADIGRDPGEIITSTHLRLDPSGDTASLVEQADAYAAAGLDVGIVYFPPPQQHRGALEAVAGALAHLA